MDTPGQSGGNAQSSTIFGGFGALPGAPSGGGGTATLILTSNGAWQAVESPN